MSEQIEGRGFAIGRLDIVDLYEWHSNKKLVYQTYFQRQFVWKEKDKKDLIDTILKGYPIPSIFICDANTSTETLSKTYNVLDGRQRLESIFEFLENKYKYQGKFFAEMSEEEKKHIMNYNVTLVQMYISPDQTDTIKEIFKRLNKNAYNLNRMEKQSTQLVEYDFMMIGKIVAGIVQFENIDSYINEIKTLFPADEDAGEVDVLETEENINVAVSESVKDICKMENISAIYSLLTEECIFTHYDIQRQIGLQYFLNIMASIIKDEAINRNVSEKIIIEISEMDKGELKSYLVEYNNACNKLQELYAKQELDAFWKTKSSFFTLSIVFTKMLRKQELNIDDVLIRLDTFKKSESEVWKAYYQASNEGVNDKGNRTLRESTLMNVLENSIE